MSDDPAPLQATAPTRPLRGTSGPLDAAALRRAARALDATGTLAVAGAAGVRLELIEAGEPLAEGTLGTAPEDDALDLPFAFHPHALPEGGGRELPELPARLPDARHPALRAWPDLPGGRELAAGPLPLRDLLEELGEARFGGVLGGRSPHGAVMVLLDEGRLLAAVAERTNGPLDRGDALRTLARHAGDPHAPPLTLTPLPTELRRALLGACLDRRGDGPDGLELRANGAVLFYEGAARARIAAAGDGPTGRFDAVADPAGLETLEPPDDPPGWEARRYGLTLRGRDALDPMTELSMRLDGELGATGKRVLRTVRAGHTVAGVAETLGLSLDQLGGWLRRLEEEGLIRGDATAERS